MGARASRPPQPRLRSERAHPRLLSIKGEGTFADCDSYPIPNGCLDSPTARVPLDAPTIDGKSEKRNLPLYFAEGDYIANQQAAKRLKRGGAAKAVGAPAGARAFVLSGASANRCFLIRAPDALGAWLPHDLPPRQTVYTYFRTWKPDGTLKRIHNAIRSEVRRADDGNGGSRAWRGQKCKKANGRGGRWIRGKTVGIGFARRRAARLKS